MVGEKEIGMIIAAIAAVIWLELFLKWTERYA